MVRWIVIIGIAVLIAAGTAFGVLFLQDVAPGVVQVPSLEFGKPKAGSRAMQTKGGASDIDLNALPPAKRSHAGSRDRNLLMLTTRNAPEENPPLPNLLRSTMSREMVRQAVLLAGREELGLATRDASLGEPFPEERAENVPIEVIAMVMEEGYVTIVIFRQSASGYEELFSRRYQIFDDPSSYDELPIYPNLLIAKLQQLSVEEFVAALKKGGFQGEPNTWKPNGNVPEEITSAIEDFRFGAQFDAVRRLHALIREDGESPERLSALVRAYVHLGSFTEPLWSPAHKVYKSRALLYAERLYDKTSGNSLALHTRAYARAIAGRPAAAMEDIEAATRRADDGDVHAASATWLPIIRAYCYSDRDALQEAGRTGEHRTLARYLLVMTHDTLDGTSLVLEDVQFLQVLCPDCFRAMELMLNYQALGVQRYGGMPALLSFLNRWPEAIEGIQGLPEKTAETLRTLRFRAESGEVRIDDIRKFAAIVRSDASASDRNEPSLGVLARWLDDWAYLRAWRVLYFEGRMLAVETDDTVDVLRPLFEGHRYGPFLETYIADPRERRAKFRDVEKSLEDNFADFEWPAATMLYELEKTPLNEFRLRSAFNRLDRDFVRDVATSAKGGNDFVLYYLGMLQRIAPEIRATVVLSLRHQWMGYADTRADEWESRFRNDPLVLEELGSAYYKQERYDDAERLYRKVVELLPQLSSYVSLAYVYKKQERFEDFKETIIEGRKHPSFGLEDAKACEAVARFHMDRGEFEEARPFALDAADSYSAWGLACAAECLAGLEEWELSHDYAKAEALRYSGSEIAWFRWCVRFDRGEFDAAEATIRSFLDRQFKPYHEFRGFHAYATGDTVTARKLFKSGFETKKRAWFGMESAMLHDAAGDTRTRDDLLQAVTRMEPRQDAPTQPSYMKLAQWMIDDLAGKHESFDADALRKQVEEAGPGAGPWLARYVGHYLRNRGREDESHEWLQYAATDPTWRHLANAMSCYDLREMGIEIEPIRYPKPPQQEP